MYNNSLLYAFRHNGGGPWTPTVLTPIRCCFNIGLITAERWFLRWLTHSRHAKPGLLEGCAQKPLFWCTKWKLALKGDSNQRSLSLTKIQSFEVHALYIGTCNFGLASRLYPRKQIDAKKPLGAAVTSISVPFRNVSPIRITIRINSV